MENQRASDRIAQQSRLRDMAGLTGGTAFFPGTMKDLDPLYARISDEVRAQYTLGYISTNTARNGAWRKVGVRVTRPGARLTVRTREGYFAVSK
jgi:Ca-activated chloride channel family protein